LNVSGSRTSLALLDVITPKYWALSLLLFSFFCSSFERNRGHQPVSQTGKHLAGQLLVIADAYSHQNEKLFLDALIVTYALLLSFDL
jgi:hypothetical protein